MLCMVAMLACLVGCSERRHLTFRYQIAEGPTTLDPARTGSIIASGVVDRIHDGLMTLDRVRHLPVPEIARSYTVSADGLVYTFELDPDARFHNGRQVLASDVKYSLERLLAPGTESEYAWALERVSGAAAYRAGEELAVSGIETAGTGIVRIHLERPFASFLLSLTIPAASIVPGEEIDQLGEQFGQSPVGCGPFRFVARNNNKIVLGAFSDHHRYSPQVGQLVFVVEPDPETALRSYQKGELDLVSSLHVGSVHSLQQGYGADLHFFPGICWYGFCFQCRQPPFDDARLRRAIALAIDRRALVKSMEVVRLDPLVGMVPSTVSGHSRLNLDDYHDPELAAKLLADAGYPQGRGMASQPYCSMSDRRQEVVLAHLQEKLGLLGIEIESCLDSSASTFQEKLQAGQLPIFRYGWCGDLLDPEAYLLPRFHSQGKSNFTRYSNPEVDRLLDSAATESDSATRLILYQQAESLIIDDAPCVSLFQSTEAILLQPVWKGIPIGYNRAFMEIEKARLEDG
jgi:ABC-type transport system substrate-binding protein